MSAFDVYRALGDGKRAGVDAGGHYVKECVKGRQIICRDLICGMEGRCKKFQLDLLLQQARRPDHQS